ncbi:AraC family transcriptional regulator [Tissierella pigra]|uniref:Helix-turn-helix transcriptional regulator n=1 Tax=Tissierella pigra TaxID=2607614 RepID=A0A6N7XYZ6_9FIRM|nr:helix-turn-helix domain-containing protein [Tissierella pigra]MBU5425089.1 AraC family transcriptional regulator [Tissierella pigra]MSU01705.1 helix-turn-helix transcriptional regulator [Tissierella pigra]
MKNIINEYYDPLLTNRGFLPVENKGDFCVMGKCWELSDSIGTGQYWIYEQKNLYCIKIHDFSFHEDKIVEMSVPRCLSITYYESISGEELIPYNRLEANCVKTFIGGDKPFKANIHKRIPIYSTGIEIFPSYYEEYLEKHYLGEYKSPYDAFQSIDETDDFPEMVMLLMQIKNYRGEGIAAKLFYDAKVTEAVALVVERQRKQDSQKQITLSAKDKELLLSVTAYIDDHYAFDITLDQLSKIACMGTTKLKTSFKLLHGCTITKYIQHRRMSKAEYLLSCTDLTINQIAQTVGYNSASRFSELFRKSTGILPNEYRIIASGNR